jgi:hypothetical protein
MIVNGERRNRLWDHATNQPWSMLYDRGCPSKSYQYYSELFNIGGRYYFVTPSVFKDYMGDIFNPTEDEKNYLKLLMDELVWCYWFDWDKFKELARNDIKTRQYATNKFYTRRCKILHEYGWE